MTEIHTYIQLPLETRQKHLRLEEPCQLRGTTQSSGCSNWCKGLLAYLLDTSLPSGSQIHVCHACNNRDCSNPNHLYWGTSAENAKDRMRNGGTTGWDHMVNKYGEVRAREIQREGRLGNQNGKGNLGTPKSEEHKRKISQALTGQKRKKPVA